MFICVFVCVSMAAVCVLGGVPDVFLLCLLRCPTRPTTGKTSPSLLFLRIASCMCMCLYVCIAYVRVCVIVCVFYVCLYVCMYVCLYVCMYVSALLSAYM